MADKEPVLLLTLIDTVRMRWLVGAIGMDGRAYPLVRSQDNDLAPYQKLNFEEQASFLRHRCCGILQRGCDRLWGLQKKACHFAFLLDQPFPGASDELTQRTADHLHEWMANPPVTFFLAEPHEATDRQPEFRSIAGTLTPELEEVFNSSLPAFLELTEQPDRWEEAPPPKA